VASSFVDCERHPSPTEVGCGRLLVVGPAPPTVGGIVLLDLHVATLLGAEDRQASPGDLPEDHLVHHDRQTPATGVKRQDYVLSLEQSSEGGPDLLLGRVLLIGLDAVDFVHDVLPV